MKTQLLSLSILLLVTNATAQNSWTIVPSGTTHDLNAIQLPIIVGDSGTLLTGGTQGTTWTALNSTTPKHLYGVVNCGSGCFYFCGDSGFVAAANSSGSVIIDRSIPGKIEALYSISIFGTDQPMVVSDSGYFARSSNGGVLFTEIITNTDEHLYGAGRNYSFTAYNFSCGANGTILITNNGGVSWSAAPTVTTNDLYDIYALQSVAAIAVGDNGTILRSEVASNGQVWSVIPCPVTTRLNAVDRDGLTGKIMAVGDGGVILRSEDDGLTWVQLISNTTEDLYDVYAVSAVAWFAVGTNGTILRSTDGGGIGVGVEENYLAALEFDVVLVDGELLVRYKTDVVVPSSVAVFDATGRAVRAPENLGSRSGVQQHRIAAPSASGTYLIQLQAGTTRSTQRIVVIAL